MTRLQFDKGKQREFFDLVLRGASCPSLRELSGRIGVNYQTLKNYYSGRRLLPKELFELLINISNLREIDFSFQEVSDNWGQVDGGSKSWLSRTGNLRREKKNKRS